MSNFDPRKQIGQLMDALEESGVESAKGLVTVHGFYNEHGYVAFLNTGATIGCDEEFLDEPVSGSEYKRWCEQDVQDYNQKYAGRCLPGNAVYVPGTLEDLYAEAEKHGLR